MNRNRGDESEFITNKVLNKFTSFFYEISISSLPNAHNAKTVNTGPRKRAGSPANQTL
jgi:hypothetical protein